MANSSQILTVFPLSSPCSNIPFRYAFRMSAKGCFFVVPVNLLLIACVVMSCDFCASSPIIPRSTTAAGAAANLESREKIGHPDFKMKITAEVNGNGLEIMTIPGGGGHRANHSHFQVINTNTATTTKNDGKNDSNLGPDADAEAEAAADTPTPPADDASSWALSPFLDKCSPNRLVRKFGYFVSLIGFGFSWIGYQFVSCSDYVANFGNWIEEFGMVVTGLGNWLALKTMI